MGLPLPPPVPPPPPPPGAISMARRRRRSASSETQVDPAGPGRTGAMGKGEGVGAPEGARWRPLQRGCGGQGWPSGVTGRGPVRGAARSDDATALYLGLRCGKEIESGGRWPTWEPVAHLSQWAGSQSGSRKC